MRALPLPDSLRIFFLTDRKMMLNDFFVFFFFLSPLLWWNCCCFCSLCAVSRMQTFHGAISNASHGNFRLIKFHWNRFEYREANFFPILSLFHLPQPRLLGRVLLILACLLRFFPVTLLAIATAVFVPDFPIDVQRLKITKEIPWHSRNVKVMEK